MIVKHKELSKRLRTKKASWSTWIENFLKAFNRFISIMIFKECKHIEDEIRCLFCIKAKPGIRSWGKTEWKIIKIKMQWLKHCNFLSQRHFTFQSHHKSGQHCCFSEIVRTISRFCRILWSIDANRQNAFFSRLTIGIDLSFARLTPRYKARV